MAVSGKNVNQRKFFQHSACLTQAMAICKKMASCNFYLNTWRQIKYQQNCNYKKGQLPNVWWGYVRFKRRWKKLSSMLILRVELKEQKCEIRWFKLCSRKLTVTSLTWSDLFFISNGTLSCSSPRTFDFQNRVVGDLVDALQHARKPKPSSDLGFVIWRRPQITRTFPTVITDVEN